jgi:N-acetyl-gamma-glutamyl-phosphate reductase
MVRCAILGAKGYTGCELIKILHKHPEVEMTFLGSRDEGVTPLSVVVPQISHNAKLKVEQINIAKIIASSDVVFLALPHTKSIEYVKALYDADKVVIDLSSDYRFKNKATYEAWYGVKHSDAELLKKAVYGLPELNREKIKTARIIANPGCYPTAVVLGLLPLIENKLVDIDTIVVDAKSGVSGAGKKLAAHTQFSELSENFYAYKVGKHQHMPEMVETLQTLDAAFKELLFVPHLLPLKRGILASLYARKKASVSKDDIVDAFKAKYSKEPFVRIKDDGVFPALQDVQYTNFCDIGIHVDPATNAVIVISAIDNLLKGASGQAVQNMNLRFGLDESAGLR